jgi:hypothetical protein
MNAEPEQKYALVHFIKEMRKHLPYRMRRIWGYPVIKPERPLVEVLYPKEERTQRDESESHR